MGQRKQDLEWLVKNGGISPVYSDYYGGLTQEDYGRLYSLAASLEDEC